MNKKFITILVTTSSLLFSCQVNKKDNEKKEKEEEEKIVVHVLDKLSVSEGSLNTTSNAVNSFSLTYNLTNLNSLFTSFDDAINSENVENVIKYRTQIDEEANKLVDKLSVAEAKYFANPSQSSYSKYMDLYNIYDSYSLKEDVSRNKALDTKNDEIVKIVFKSNKALYCSDISRASQLQNAMNEVNETAEEMRANTSKYTLENYLKQGLTLFKNNYANACNEFATLYGYEDYQSYVYENTYFRKYKVSDANSLVSFVKDKIVPLYQEMDYLKYSEEAQEYIKLAEKECFVLDSLKLGTQMDEFAGNMGKEYSDSYTHLFNDGYYIFSNASSCNNVAITYPLKSVNDGLLYFGKKYQAINDVAHEFGHYLANALNDENTSKSFDINETFSQGNEMLFASFLMNNYENEALKGVGESLLNNLHLMVLGYCYATEVENYLFENYKSKTINELYADLNDIYASYGTSKLRKDYWFGPTLINTSYYSSYLTSAVQSLQLFNIAKTDFRGAKNKYISLISEPENLGEVEAWKKAGFTSPFDASTIDKVAEIFNK